MGHPSRLPPYASQGEPAHPQDAVPDFAFADTVVAADLEEAIPASGVVVSDPTGSAHQVMPVTYELPAQTAPTNLGVEPEAGVLTRFHSVWSRMRRGMKASREEMTYLWSATASLEESHDARGVVVYDEDPFVRAATVGRRVRTLFSFFEWDRADVVRAAWIGVAVFVIAATVGAIMLERRPSTPTLVQTSAVR